MDSLAEKKREVQYAKDRLERAEFIFNNCPDDMIDYANAELTAAFEYLRYIIKVYSD